VSQLQTQLINLVIVACHSLLRSKNGSLPDVENDSAWILLPYQIGEPPFFVEHIRRGVVEAARNPFTALCFSGVLSRRGAVWSEAESYRRVAESKEWWMTESFVSGQKDPARWRPIAADFPRRCFEDKVATDSFWNVLGPLCLFFQQTGGFPRHVTLISFLFKKNASGISQRSAALASRSLDFPGSQSTL
jgi:hypothetical protein